MLTWNAFWAELPVDDVLLGGAEAPVGFAELVLGFAAETFPFVPEFAPEVLEAVPGWPVKETSCPTREARLFTLPASV